MKPTRVEIVRARHKGVTGYASLARGTGLGNPYQAGVGGCTDPVESYRRLFYDAELGCDLRRAALALLDREWEDGVVRIACPCNGEFHDKKDQLSCPGRTVLGPGGKPIWQRVPVCHASIVKKFLERAITTRGEK